MRNDNLLKDDETEAAATKTKEESRYAALGAGSPQAWARWRARSKLGKIDSEKLISDIAEGVAVTIACAAQGIHRDTFYSWLEEQPEFAVKLAAAKRDVIVKAIAGIRTGSKDDEWRGQRLVSGARLSGSLRTAGP